MKKLLFAVAAVLLTLPVIGILLTASVVKSESSKTRADCETYALAYNTYIKNAARYLRKSAIRRQQTALLKANIVIQIITKADCDFFGHGNYKTKLLLPRARNLKLR